MKNSSLIILMIGASITIMAALSFFITGCWIRPLTTLWLGDYHVLADLLSVLTLYGFMSAALVRISLRLHPPACGKFDLTDPRVSYWKFLFMTCYFGSLALKPFTSFTTIPLIMRLFGGKIGHDLGTGMLMHDAFLINIGNESIIGANALVCSNLIADGQMIIGPVKIGNNVTIGVGCFISPDVEIGDGAVISFNSVVMPGSRVPAGETWRGNPARKWQ